jgi:hypothetical protein
MRKICLFLAAGAVLGGAFASPGTAPAVAAPGAHPGARTTTCGQVDEPFTPKELSIPRVVGRTRVLALGRDRRGVPRPPPLTNKGKWEFAWDKDSKIRAGSPHGVVRLTAHTYPRFAGLALGNRLLSRLRTGARLSVSGPDGEQLCYRVVKRVSVPAAQSVPAYYTSAGPPRLAILVCSGKRRGPGDWSRRTIWFAAPTLKAANG